MNNSNISEGAKWLIFHKKAKIKTQQTLKICFARIKL